MGELLRWFIIYKRKFLLLECSACLLACLLAHHPQWRVSGSSRPSADFVDEVEVCLKMPG